MANLGALQDFRGDSMDPADTRAIECLFRLRPAYLRSAAGLVNRVGYFTQYYLQNDTNGNYKGGLQPLLGGALGRVSFVTVII